MKIPLLPELDLARIAPQPIENRRDALEAFRLSYPPYRYLPLRKSLSDIFDAQTGFLPAGPRVPFAKIAECIRAESRSPEEYEANLRVAEGLYNYAETNKIQARQNEFPAIMLGGGARITYWHSLHLNIDGRPVVPFVDPRRSATRLTPLARRFVFSVMHERIRVSYPDFAEVRLGIFQFTIPENGPRIPKLHTDQDIALFSFDELQDMVRETNEMWTDVYLQRIDRERKRG